MRGRAVALLLCLLVPACGASDPPADLVVLDADVHTAADAPRARAFAVRDGRFVAIGENRDVEALAGPGTVVIRADGAAVLPGLIDAHVHFGSGIPLLRGVNLYGVGAKAEWLRRVAERAEELPEGTWILGGRWDHTLAEGGVLPTRADLDAVAPRHPVALADVDGHSTWVNSLALEIAGITADTPDPEGGRILHDEAGEPTGILLEAGWLVTRHVPELDIRARLDALHDTLRFAAGVGITTAHDMASASRLDDYVALLEQDRLPVRIWFGTYGGPEDVEFLVETRDRIEAAVAGLTAPREGLRLQHGYVKLGIDGVLSTRTAALLEPYADDPTTTGLPGLEQEALDELVAAYNAAGFPVAIHAIGDRGVRMSLDAFERSQARHAPPLPNRVEHDEVVSPDDAGRFAALGVIASMTPHLLHLGDRQVQHRASGARTRRLVVSVGTASRSRRDPGLRQRLGHRTARSDRAPLRRDAAREAGGRSAGWLVSGQPADLGRGAAGLYHRARPHHRPRRRDWQHRGRQARRLRVAGCSAARSGRSLTAGSVGRWNLGRRRSRLLPRRVASLN